MAWHKNLHKWLHNYITLAMRSALIKKTIPKHIMFCVADHYEPFAGKVQVNRALDRVASWQDVLPVIHGNCKDSTGKGYRHSFFYPVDEYDKQVVEQVAGLCQSGCGELEIHLHHDNDSSENLRKTLLSYKELFSNRHSGLSTEKKTGLVKYGFIHGNWALDNSRPDGCWCGVNDELTILQQTGCYADFTMPSAPDITQTSTINSIYYAIDDPNAPKSHNRGFPASVGKENAGLLLVQGPLTLNWSARKKGLLPAIENGELGYGRPPTADRFQLWLQQNIHVESKGDWLFIKLHTHGAPEKNADVLLGDEMSSFLLGLADMCESLKCHLHYVTARELYNIVKAAEAGESGIPDDFRNYLLHSNSWKS